MGSLAVEPGHYAAVAFAALAVGLLVGTWWGHARFLIVIGVLLLPVAWTASLVDVPLDAAWGSVRHDPTTVADVRDEYRISGGQLTLDLSNLDPAEGEPLAVDASVAFGQLHVLVPEGAAVEIDASVGGGEIRLFDQPLLDGTRLEDRASLGSGEPTFIIDLEAGLGSIVVESIQPEDR
jgi:Cell wall-active antibiotics response 4TMS YvqF